ncbi:MAG TPA: 2TM domain-containing protein [Flavobacterium sp.]|jgi:hypothetical protein
MEEFKSIEQQKIDRARRRIKSIAGFYKHLIIYLVVNSILLSLKYFQRDPGEDFMEFNTFSMAFFWGIGVIFHAFGVFTENLFFGREWEDRKMRELMEKEKRQKWE